MLSRLAICLIVVPLALLLVALLAVALVVRVVSTAFVEWEKS